MVSNFAFAQVSLEGNEWINYDQEYWKLKTTEDGIYRIRVAELQASGFPIAAVNPRHIQLFYKGREQAIRVEGEEDGRLDPNDVIYFYGRRNDGEQDAELYRPTDAQPHQYYNIYTDSAAFFLTYSKAGQMGKRIERASLGGTTIASLPAIDFSLAEILRIETGAFYAGISYTLSSITNIFMSWLDYGSAFVGSQIRKGQGRNHTLSGISNVNTSGPKPTLEIMLVGRNQVRHTAQIFVGPDPSNLRLIGTMEYDNHDAARTNYTLEFSDLDLNSGQTIVRVFSSGVGVSQDLNCPAYFLLRYPKLFSGSAREVMEIPNSTALSRLTLNDAENLFDVWDITQADNIIALPIASAGTTRHIGLLANAGDRRLLKSDVGEVKDIGLLEKISFEPIDFEDYNFFIITNKLLQVPAGGYQDPVEAYRAYRSSEAGGSYKAIVLEINDLYNQFSYGDPNAMAVFRVVKAMYERSENPLLFLVGKPMNPRLSPYRVGNTNPDNTDFVPTAGEPLSDNLYSLGLGGDPYIPVVPTGRLNARSAADVAAYLNKVIENEARPFTDLSYKRLLHLSGGTSQIELNAFKSFVDQFATIAEGPFLGAATTTISKRTTNTVELINVSQEVNEGVNLITFFGHSSADVADIDVGFVSDDGFGYQNKGRYPIMIVNGCDAGNYSTPNKTFGEDWIITPDRGAVGFLAHSHVGITPQLRRFTEIFYRTGLTDSVFINKTVGDVVYEGFRQMITSRNRNIADIAHVQQSNFQGDPALRLFRSDDPDYAVVGNEIHTRTFDGSPRVTLEMDSFQVAVPVRNLGRALFQQLEWRASRTLPDGRVEDAPLQVVENIFHKDTLYVNFRTQPGETSGTNTIQIALDPDGKLSELQKDNNVASFVFDIRRSGTLHIYPPPFGLESDAELSLRVQSSDLLGGERVFEIQLDTTRYFNSPARRQTLQNAEGQVQWDQNLSSMLSPNDTTAIFWRSRFADPRADEDTTWTESSFTVIPGIQEGWAQVHPEQFTFNNSPGMVYNPQTKQWEFGGNTKSISIQTFGGDHPDFGNLDVDVILNGLQLIISASYGVCRTNTLNAIAFDQFSTDPYRVLQYNAFEVNDPASCGRIPQVINNMTQSDITGGRRMIENYISRVKDGDPVIFFSIGTVQYGTWRDETYAAFESIGLDGNQVRALSPGHPIIIFGRKGAALGEAQLITSSLAQPEQANLVFETILEGKFGQGQFQTPPIGPAVAFDRLELQVENRDGNEQFSLQIEGEKPDGQREPLFSRVQSESIILNNVDTNVYPQIRLEGSFTNEISFNPALLRHWFVFYDAIPDGALFFRAASQGNEIVQGTPYAYPMEFVNISSGFFQDSLRVEYTLVNQTSGTSQREEMLIPAPAPGASTPFEIPVNTLSMLGVNDLQVSVNLELQPERDYRNNILSLPGFLAVTPDQVNPLVDVAFDGQYIMDGDLVTSSPLIRIEIKDDNRFIQKADTTGISLAIRRPCSSCGFEPIRFSDARLQWFPADGQEPYRIEYRPEFQEDGIYALQVLASDAAGNPSSAEPFLINFEVSTQSAITHFYPYPNPFSTQTRFVFTLGGSEIPDQISIQIMTLSGKVVREINMDELGPIRIGNNISEFAWDGTDSFGDRLANGVYFYRVRVIQGGEEMARRESAGDRAFNKGYGKLYILR
jgi:hypothetical protein